MMIHFRIFDWFTLCFQKTYLYTFDMHVYGVSRTAQCLKMGQVQMGQSGRQCERVGYRWGGGGGVGGFLGKMGLRCL